MTSRKPWRALVPVLVAAAVVLVPVTQADAACKPKLTPSTVVAGKNSKTVTVAVTGCGTALWTVQPTDGGPMLYVESGDPKQTFTIGDINGLVNLYAGKHAVELVAWNGAGKKITDSNRTITWLRRTDFPAFNASPEPVKKGAKMTLAGDVRRVNWDTNAYDGYANHKVTVQRKLPGGTYTNVKTVTTDSAGHFSTTVKASKTATWRVRSSANSVSAASVSTADAVKVK